MSELREIVMNDGRTVVQPAARARYLVTRRLAKWADDIVPLEPADEGEVFDSIDYTGLSKDELIHRAEIKQVPTYGTKAQLIERLTDHDIAQLSATDTPVGATTEDEPSNPPGSDDDDS